MDDYLLANIDDALLVNKFDNEIQIEFNPLLHFPLSLESAKPKESDFMY